MFLSPEVQSPLGNKREQVTCSTVFLRSDAMATNIFAVHFSAATIQGPVYFVEKPAGSNDD